MMCGWSRNSIVITELWKLCWIDVKLIENGLEGPKFEILGILDRADDPKMVEIFFLAFFDSESSNSRKKTIKNFSTTFWVSDPLGLSHFKAENC